MTAVGGWNWGQMWTIAGGIILAGLVITVATAVIRKV